MNKRAIVAEVLLPDTAEKTIAGLRDRAILTVDLQVGLRRAKIAALKTAICIRVIAESSPYPMLSGVEEG